MKQLQDSVQLDGFDEFNAMLQRMIEPIRRAEMPVDKWGEVVTKLEQIHMDYFTSQAGPSGPWVPLAPYTVKKKGHSIILRELDLLMSSLTTSSAQHSIRQMDLYSLIFGTNRPHAGKHQDGDGIIPQREHTGLTEYSTDEIVDMVADAFVEQMFAA